MKVIQRQATVLLVEDLLPLQSLLAHSLESQHLKVLTAKNGKEALKIAFHEPCDLVLANVLMPTMTGIELTRALNSHPATYSIPVVFLSVLDREELWKDVRDLPNVMTCLWKNEMSLSQVVNKVLECLEVQKKLHQNT